MDFDILAYAMLGLSLLASAIKMGNWILHPIPGPSSMRGAGLARACRSRGGTPCLAGHERPLRLRDDAGGVHAAGVRRPPRVGASFLGPSRATDFLPSLPDLSPGGGAGRAASGRSPTADPDLVQRSIAVLQRLCRAERAADRTKAGRFALGRRGSAAVRQRALAHVAGGGARCASDSSRMRAPKRSTRRTVASGRSSIRSLAEASTSSGRSTRRGTCSSGKRLACHVTAGPTWAGAAMSDGC